MIGPDEILQVAVDHCDSSPDITLEDLKNAFEECIAKIEKRQPERAKSDRAEVGEWLERAQTDIGEMRTYLRWLFIQERFQIVKIIKELGYLPKDCGKWGRDKWKKYKSLAVEQQDLESSDPQEPTEKDEALAEGESQATESRG